MQNCTGTRGLEQTAPSFSREMLRSCSAQLHRDLCSTPGCGCAACPSHPIPSRPVLSHPVPFGFAAGGKTWCLQNALHSAAAVPSKPPPVLMQARTHNAQPGCPGRDFPRHCLPWLFGVAARQAGRAAQQKRADQWHGHY